MSFEHRWFGLGGHFKHRWFGLGGHLSIVGLDFGVSFIHIVLVLVLVVVLRGRSNSLFDEAIAKFSQVPTYRLNEAVKRNSKRFPEDFMFQLTKSEFEDLRSQIAISKRGGRRYLPSAFTEQGVAMLSGVLNSDIAIEVNINIMRAFVQVRRLGMTVVDLKRKIDSMERKFAQHDHQFKIVFDTIRQLLAPPPLKKKGRMGFTKDK